MERELARNNTIFRFFRHLRNTEQAFAFLDELLPIHYIEGALLLAALTRLQLNTVFQMDFHIFRKCY